MMFNDAYIKLISFGLISICFNRNL